MGITLKIYAENFQGDRWHAEPVKLYIEEIRGYLTGESWLEPEPIYADRNDNLSEILGVRQPFNDLTQIATQPRGFPQDISDELIDYFARSYLHDWWQEPQDWQLLRQRARRLLFSQSWLLLGELLGFDWQGHYQRHYGEVKQEYAPLFGDGQQPFPMGFLDGVTRVFSGRHPCQPGHVRVSWIETYAYKVGDRFMNEVLPRLQSFGAPDEVRIVYWLVA